MEHSEQIVGMFINLPRSLKDDFKRKLELKGASMSAVIRLLIAEYLAENNAASKTKLKSKRSKNKKGSA